jgi:probable F420-dependent oxidoreductase
MYDHVVGAARGERNPPLWESGPYTDQHPFHDPLIAFGYLAGITKKIELITGILILPQRQTVLVARQAADVDLLSGGRLGLGVGAGWNYVEFDALGQSFATRGDRLAEQIQYLRDLWREPLLTFKGEFDQIDRAAINPRPKREIPIYCGGFSDVAYRRAAKLADGFILAASFSEQALPAWKRVRQLLLEANRTTDEFRAHYLVQDHMAAGLDFNTTMDTLKRWEDAGGTHASIVTMGRRYKTADEHIDHLAEVRRRLDSL